MVKNAEFEMGPDGVNRAFAIFGHPGHELFSLNWIEIHAAEVFCLTDGSGGAMSDRTGFSRSAIERAGGTVGCVMGACADKALYADFVAGDPSRLAAMARAIVDRALVVRPQVVLTDPLEYFNPVHDIANTIADLVITALAAEGRTARKLVYPNEYPHEVSGLSTELEYELDADSQARKMQAVLDYTPLNHELRRLSEADKVSMLRTERYYPDPVRLDLIPDAADTPYGSVFYEDYGRRMVAEGRYDTPITLDRHFRPMAARLVKEVCPAVPSGA